MKKLVIRLQRRVPENRKIQGLYSPKNTDGSFWSLRARIELSIFQGHKMEEK